jgi:hypothetical protein
MLNKGPNLPGTGADDSAVGSVLWSNESEITLDNGLFAEASLNDDISHYLKADNFGFSIPSGVTITGIVVEWYKAQLTTTRGAIAVIDNAVRIVKDGSIGSTDKSNGTAWGIGSLVTYGGSSDLWGESWTAEDINDPTFGAVISAQLGASGSNTAQVDYCKITVYYTEEGLLDFGGFEIGVNENINFGVGAISVQSTIKRSGSYALRATPVSTGLAWIRCVPPSSASGAAGAMSAPDLYTRFNIYIGSLPSAGSEEIFAVADNVNTLGEPNKMTLRINSDGKLMAFGSDGVTQIGSTGTTILELETWYTLYVYCGTGASAAWSVSIGEDIEISGTDDVGTSNAAAWRFGKSVDRNGEGYDIYFDDWAVSLDAMPSDGSCLAMVAGSDGTYQDFSIGAGSGEHYTNVDEIPPDSDTTYIVSNLVVNDAETYGVVSAASVGISGIINAAKSLIYRKRDELNGNFKHRFRSGGLNYDGISIGSTSTYQSNVLVWNKEPSTGLPWNIPTLDDVEIGYIENNQTRATRVTTVCLMVDFTFEEPEPPEPPEPPVETTIFTPGFGNMEELPSFRSHHIEITIGGEILIYHNLGIIAIDSDGNVFPRRVEGINILKY